MKIENNNKIIASNGPLVIFNSKSLELVLNQSEVVKIDCFIDEVIINNNEFELNNDNLLLVTEKSNFVNELPEYCVLVDEDFSINMDLEIDFGGEIGIKTYDEIQLFELENDILDNAHDDMSSWITKETELNPDKDLILNELNVFVNIN